MKLQYASRLLLVAGMAGAMASPAIARDDPALEQRLQRIERMLDSRGLVEMLERLDQLQREVQQLRGEQEVQGNKLDGMQRRQRDLYLDIDRRLHRLEVGAVKAPPTIPDATLAPPAAAPVPSQVPVPSAAPTPAQAAEAGKERDAYENALDILKEGRYEDAAKSFRVFRASYPGSRYAANAQYWLGEAYYVTRQFDTALKEFSQVVEAFPQSGKVADARLKMGFIHYELKDWAAARKALESVVAQYPGSTAARLASNRLERMTQEGH